MSSSSLNANNTDGIDDEIHKLVFDYCCSRRSKGMVDELIKLKWVRPSLQKSSERYMFHQIHLKVENGEDCEEFYRMLVLRIVIRLHLSHLSILILSHTHTFTHVN